MKAADRFKDPPTSVNELWQTDFSYLKVVHWDWYYLTTILDDYSGSVAFDPKYVFLNQT
jgi:hypothetical protein